MQNDLTVDSRGGIFKIRAVHDYDPANPVPGQLSLYFANGSGEKADLVVESYFPASGLIWESGWINDDEDRRQEEPLIFHVGRAVHVKRWRPGLFGIPGDGGGEAFLTLPEFGSVTLEISCLG